MDLNSSYVILFVICIILSAFFSGSETALTSLSEAKTRQLMDKKHRAKPLKLWLNNPIRVLTTILIGNNVVNTLAAALATVIAQCYFSSLAIGIATGGATICLLIFGEITPKTFARHNADGFSLAAMTLLVPLYWLISPIVFFLSWFSFRLVKLSGGKTGENEPVATEEDIEFMIRLGHQEGVLQKQEGQMLESVIEFRDTLVKEVLISRTAICALKKDTPRKQIVEQIKKHGHSRWPVYEEDLDNIVGIFCAKDLLMAQGDSNFKLQNHLRAALFVPDMMKIGELLKEFRQGKAHLAIVVGEYGGTAGIITLKDVIEEIVGEIRDEYDDEEKERTVRPLANGTFLADASVRICDLHEQVGVEIPESEPFDSLGGFLISTYGKMPLKGTSINFDQWCFTIKDADQKQVKQVVIAITNKLQKSNTAKKSYA